MLVTKSDLVALLLTHDIVQETSIGSGMQTTASHGWTAQQVQADLILICITVERADPSLSVGATAREQDRQGIIQVSTINSQGSQAN